MQTIYLFSLFLGLFCVIVIEFFSSAFFRIYSSTAHLKSRKIEKFYSYININEYMYLDEFVYSCNTHTRQILYYNY
jgi:hypothetical protein